MAPDECVCRMYGVMCINQVTMWWWSFCQIREPSDATSDLLIYFQSHRLCCTFLKSMISQLKIVEVPLYMQPLYTVHVRGFTQLCYFSCLIDLFPWSGWTNCPTSISKPHFEEYRQNISTVKLALLFTRQTTCTVHIQAALGEASLTAVLHTHITSPEIKEKWTTRVKNSLKMYTHIYKNKITQTAHDDERFPLEAHVAFRLHILDECFQITGSTIWLYNWPQNRSYRATSSSRRTLIIQCKTQDAMLQWTRCSTPPGLQWN